MNKKDIIPSHIRFIGEFTERTVMATESEQQELDQAVLSSLVGTEVAVIAGNILKDTIVKPLTAEGAQNVYDRLRARGFKVVRV